LGLTKQVPIFHSVDIKKLLLDSVDINNYDLLNMAEISYGRWR